MDLAGTASVWRAQVYGEMGLIREVQEKCSEALELFRQLGVEKDIATCERALRQLEPKFSETRSLEVGSIWSQLIYLFMAHIYTCFCFSAFLPAQHSCMSHRIVYHPKRRRYGC